MNKWKFTVHTKNEVRTVKNKIKDVILKKFKSYSFLIFLVLIILAFIIITQVGSHRGGQKPVGKVTTTLQPTDSEKQLEKEVFKLPLAEQSPQIARGMWDSNASAEEQVNAIVKVGNTFYMNNGIDYTIDKDTPFNVLASLSGTVKKVIQDSLLGYYVEVEHLYGIKTCYSSLESVNVVEGDKISQDHILGIAGQNNFDKDSGIHVHFEIRHGSLYLNPNNVIGTEIGEYNN